jgi:hypothetical protein
MSHVSYSALTSVVSPCVSGAADVPLERMEVLPPAGTREGAYITVITGSDYPLQKTVRTVDGVTAATTPPFNTLYKTIKNLSVADADLAASLVGDQGGCTDPAEWAKRQMMVIFRLLSELQDRPDCAIVPGEPIGGDKLENTRRIKNASGGDQPTLRDRENILAWVDCDKIPTPEGLDLTNLVECGKVARRTLPPAFHNAQCITQATSNHIFKGLRVRLWFLLSHNMTAADLRLWFATSPVDSTVYEPQSIIYTSIPNFQHGRSDPMLGNRIAMVDGDPCVQPLSFGERQELRDRSRSTEDHGPAPERSALAGPSEDAVVALLSVMPNPKSVNRDIWFNVGRAVAGARAGLIARDGSLPSAGKAPTEPVWRPVLDGEVLQPGCDVRMNMATGISEVLEPTTTPINTGSMFEFPPDPIVEAWIGWTRRYEGRIDNHEAHNPENLRKKWDADIGKLYPNHYAGWRKLIQHAKAFGLDDETIRRIAGVPDAQDEFNTDDTSPEALWRDIKAPPVETFSADDVKRALAETEAAKKPKLPPLLSMDDIDNLPEPTWLIDGLLPSQGSIVPYGRPKSGKTFIVLSMALHVAAGVDWMNLATKKGVVVYVAGEGYGGVSLRIKAAKAEYGIDNTALFWMLPARVNFSDPEAVALLIERIRAIVPPGMPIALVVFDTLARMIPGLDENSAQGMGIAVAAADTVRETLGCAVAMVHHAGKDETKGMRGSSALLGSVDTTLLVTRDKDTGLVTMSVEDQKEDEPCEPMTFNMKRIELGKRSSLVPLLIDQLTPAAPTTPTAIIPEGVKLTAKVRIGLVALEAAIAKHGKPLPPEIGIGTGVESAAWRDELNSRLSDDPTETTKQRSSRRSSEFTRAREGLQSREIIGFMNDWVWIIPQKTSTASARKAAEDEFHADTAPPPIGAKVTEGL